MELNKIIGIIPARMKSTRFPGKPLMNIQGIPMIKRVYLQVKKSPLINIVVATEDEEIKSYCEQEQIPVIMTSNTCQTGTDRLAEIAKKEDYDLYINIQGDEPVISPETINVIIEEFEKYGKKYAAYNLYKKISDEEELNSNSSIKVITNEEDELMYMSRRPIPYNKSEHKLTSYKQICVYGFTRDALNIFSKVTKTRNEKFEDIEILRFLDLGYKIKMKETNLDSIAVDYPEDIKKVEDFLNNAK